MGVSRRGLRYHRIRYDTQAMPIQASSARRAVMSADVSTQFNARSPGDPQDPKSRLDSLVHSARIKGQRVWLELLRDREEWNETPDWAQNEAFKAVSAQLGSQFSYCDASIYECSGQSHRIGQFEHVRTGARFNLLPGGSFEMGGTMAQEQPRRRLSVASFLMAATALTQAQWDRVGGADERKWRGAQRPIESCSWDDVQDWLSKAGDGLSLPSEAEWEYACRAGTQSDYSFGNDRSQSSEYAWTFANSKNETHDVGLLKPNAFGLSDMHGDVWEWCQDAWHGDYHGAPDDASPWASTRILTKVARGGSWYSLFVQSWIRAGNPASDRKSFLGFRPCVHLE